MRAFAAVVVAVLLTGCGGGSSARHAASAPAAAAPVSGPGPCQAPTVHRTPYPGHGQGLDGLPWIAGAPADTGLIGLLWYWPPRWRTVHDARIWTGGQAPAGYSTKILWVFLGHDAADRADTELRVAGRRMDGPGRFSDSFTGIGYEGSGGAPSYASIIDIPRPGCWRLTLTTGSLRATVDIQAVPAPSS